MTQAQDRAFLDVEQALLEDPDDDVVNDDDGFAVKGVLFATRSTSGNLLVDLPVARATDLIARGVATAPKQPGQAKGQWVEVTDTEDWIELATEAHQFVGEPAVGHDS